MFEVWQGVPGIIYQSVPSITIPWATLGYFTKIFAQVAGILQGQSI